MVLFRISAFPRLWLSVSAPAALLRSLPSASAAPRVPAGPRQAPGQPARRRRRTGLLEEEGSCLREPAGSQGCQKTVPKGREHPGTEKGKRLQAGDDVKCGRTLEEENQRVAASLEITARTGSIEKRRAGSFLLHTEIIIYSFLSRANQRN